MSTISDTDRQRIAERYPKPRTPRWVVVTAVAVIGALLTAYWLWISAHHSTPELTAHVASFRVVSDNTVEADVLIDRARPEQSGQCLVHVQALNYERVGEMMVQVPPSEHKIEQTTVSIRTIRRAMAATVSHCIPD